MSNLPPDIRVVVSLAMLEGLTYQEISDAANIPVGTVRSRLSSGRKRLQSLLKAHAVADEIKSVAKPRQSTCKLAVSGPLMPVQNRPSELLK